jgi:copper chaperone
MATLDLTVQNVKCGGCASAIQEGLTGLPGIERVKVDIASGHVHIEGDKLDPDTIGARLAELGYPIVA